MKQVRFLFFFVATLVIAFLPQPSQAEIRPNTLTLSPFAGFYVFEGNQRLKDAPTFGLAVGYNLTERWGVEGVASYLQSEVKEGYEDNVDIYNVSFDVLYHFAPASLDLPLIPYVVAGVGWLSSHPGWGESDEHARFNYGLGLKYFLTDNVGLRADVRHILVDGDLDQDDQIYNNLSYTVGLTFQLGPFSQSSDNRQRKPPVEVWDVDGDGVLDQYDRCPNTPPGSPVDGFGCPPITAPVAK